MTDNKPPEPEDELGDFISDFLSDIEHPELIPHCIDTDDNPGERLRQKLLARERRLEKAYGDCHNCYGKGYATVNDRWIGHDTDTDIGSPGGTVTGGNPNAMKFCSCERGKQLESHMRRLVLEARIDELEQFEPLQRNHDKCPDPRGCIGYENAASDFDNEKAIRLNQLNTTEAKA